MGALEDLTQEVALLKAQVAALAPVGPQVRHMTLMDDVHVGATTPLADGHGLFWNDAQHAWLNGPSSGGTILHDYFLDGTGTSLSSGGLFDWVIATSVYPASDSLLDLSTPTTPTVITPGIYTVMVTAGLDAATDVADQRIAGAITRGSDVLVTQVQAAPSSSTNTLLNAVALTMRHECEAGDLFFVQVQFSGGGSHSPYKLTATVEAET